jgi:hypothetical protein
MNKLQLNYKLQTLIIFGGSMITSGKTAQIWQRTQNRPTFTENAV